MAEKRYLLTPGPTPVPPEVLAVLAEQMRRMLQDPRVRALGVEFGTQWIHVRGFDEFKGKSERLFPGFDAALRAKMPDMVQWP